MIRMLINISLTIYMSHSMASGSVKPNDIYKSYKSGIL